MTTPISSSAALAVIEPAFPAAEKLALAGFLAGYSGLTRDAYALDLRQFTAWCRQRRLRWNYGVGATWSITSAARTA
jgi:hypothetical protein